MVYNLFIYTIVRSFNANDAISGYCHGLAVNSAAYILICTSSYKVAHYSDVHFSFMETQNFSSEKCVYTVVVIRNMFMTFVSIKTVVERSLLHGTSLRKRNYHFRQEQL